MMSLRYNPNPCPAIMCVEIRAATVVGVETCACSPRNVVAWTTVSVVNQGIARAWRLLHTCSAA
jgi:hypothetical protein